jgi:hypothetical protein
MMLEHIFSTFPDAIHLLFTNGGKTCSSATAALNAEQAPPEAGLAVTSSAPAATSELISVYSFAACKGAPRSDAACARYFGTVLASNAERGDLVSGA